MHNKMPKEAVIDNTWNLMKDGYYFIMNRRNQLNSDVFETRLLGKKAICMVGKEAAKVFYDEEKFKRNGAAPKRVKETLFGVGGLQTLDGKTHKHRKEMFMSIMTKNNLEKLNEILKDQWDMALHKWTKMKEIIFYEEVQEILASSACRWAGIPVEDMNIPTKQLAAMFESPAKIGPLHWHGRNARNEMEKWIRKLIEEVRADKIHPPEHTALHQFSWHRNLEGKYIDSQIAAVEVINVLRPIVAVSIYINFIVLALHDHPDQKEKLKNRDEKYNEIFIQEIRRYYPFFPFLTAIVNNSFIWNDYKFEQGTLTLLDLYGTNHHPELWDRPNDFHPERFTDQKIHPYSFIPQGGGDYFSNHRCPGEGITLEIMKLSVDFLVNRMTYELPEQDFSLKMNDIPCIPKSKILLRNIKSI